MRKLITKSFSLSLVTVLLAILTPAWRAQQQSTTRVIPSPDGGFFMVDGQLYQHAASFIWPQGSKHTLFAPPPDPLNTTPGVQYAFQSFSWSGGGLIGNPAYITADPAINQYTVSFSLQYAVTVTFYNCTNAPCLPPGTVYFNGAALTNDTTQYVDAKSTVTLQAVPNPGYVFVGWSAGTAQTITGFLNKVAINGPTVISALFAPARPINFATVPAGLTVLADRTPVPTPGELDWGIGTTHTLGIISPQADTLARHWVFSSWSDGGAATHAYKVASSPMPDTVTANFIPGVGVEFVTQPANLSLNIDGRTNWPAYLFTWGVGETHTAAAPATQSDTAGHIWQFANWSDGAAASRSFTVPSDNTSITNGVRLIATYNPMAHAVINSSIAGLNLIVDGSPCSAPCDIVRPVGAQVTVTAPASISNGSSSRQDFAGWSNGAAGALTLNLANTDMVTVSANYKTMNYLAASSNPSGSVSFSLQPSSPDNYYDTQTRVSVTAAALPGYRFHSWSGDLSGSSPSGTVSMDAPRAVQAVVDKVPYVAPTGISNGAGATPVSAVAPGSVVSIFGANLASSVFLGQGSPLSQTLGGVTVQVGGNLLPLFFVSPTQINVQLPANLNPGPAGLTVSAQGQPDVQAQFTVAQDAPGIFPQSVNGQTYALAFHADGSTVTPSAPAAPGETITVYGTGFGATTPSRPVGFAVPSDVVYTLNDGATVQLNGTNMPVSSGFALAGSVGVDVVQFVVGDGAPSNTNAQLTITVNGQASNTILLPMQ
jgi:uncharacterized protein (TIGR03437 family)